MNLSEHDRITLLEQKMSQVEKQTAETVSKLATFTASAGTKRGATMPSYYLYPALCMYPFPPIFMAPPPPPPDDDSGFDLGDLGDLLRGFTPKSGGTGTECTDVHVWVNWSSVPRTKEVTIAHIGNVTVKVGSRSISLQGTGSTTLSIELPPGDVLEVHIDANNAKFGAWW